MIYPILWYAKRKQKPRKNSHAALLAEKPAYIPAMYTNPTTPGPALAPITGLTSEK